MEIQLVIRASNQNIEDQVVNCTGDWTVFRLKTHLSEVYPYKPIVQDQKLIYSGHLLQDYLKLKDVVRSDAAESNVHIFHLVCNAKYPQVQRSESSQDPSNQPLSTHSTGLIYPVGPTLQPTTHSYVPEMDTSQMTPYAFSAFYNNPQLLAQMTAMQQMYAQYMIHYWQSFVPGMSGNPTVIPVMPNIQANQSSENSASQAPPQQQANQRVNVVVDDDFDWFDIALHHCRFLILLSIMYFYSSPERFIIVMFLIVFTVLYREGWIFRPVVEDAVIRIRQPPEEVANDPVNDGNEEAPLNNEDAGNAQELEAAMDGENPPHAQNPDVINNNQRNSFFSIVAAFFSSLVPEPPPPVNIN